MHLSNKHLSHYCVLNWASLGGSGVKNPPVNAGDVGVVGNIPWRREWPHTLVFLSGKSHGQRSLVGYGPWGCKRVRYDLRTEHVCLAL